MDAPYAISVEKGEPGTIESLPSEAARKALISTLLLLGLFKTYTKAAGSSTALWPVAGSCPTACGSKAAVKRKSDEMDKPIVAEKERAAAPDIQHLRTSGQLVSGRRGKVASEERSFRTTITNSLVGRKR